MDLGRQPLAPSYSPLPTAPHPTANSLQHPVSVILTPNNGKSQLCGISKRPFQFEFQVGADCHPERILEALDIVLGNDLDFCLACEGYVARG
jgi:hypothetical protein